MVVPQSAQVGAVLIAELGDHRWALINLGQSLREVDPGIRRAC
jgi:hypothetical protein